MRRLLLCVALIPSGFGSPGLAQVAEGESSVALVQQLGSASFDERERATKELLRIGVSAKDALRAGREDPDPEIRRRARALYGKVRELDRDDRIARLVADEAGKESHELVGWTRYQKLIGGDTGSRQLFAAIYRQWGGLLEATESNPAAASEQVVLRIETLSRTIYRTPTPKPEEMAGDAAGILFLAMDEDLTLPSIAQQRVSSILQHQLVLGALRKEPLAEPAGKLIRNWLDQLSDVSALRNVFQAAIYANMPECLDRARRELGNRGANPYVTAAAMIIVCRFSNEDKQSHLIPFLDDQRQVIQTQIQVKNVPLKLTTEARDVALSLLVLLQQESLADYGFDRYVADPNYRGSPLQHPNLHELGFISEESRQKAFDRWREKHPELAKPAAGK